MIIKIIILPITLDITLAKTNFGSVDSLCPAKDRLRFVSERADTSETHIAAGQTPLSSLGLGNLGTWFDDV